MSFQVSEVESFFPIDPSRFKNGLRCPLVESNPKCYNATLNMSCLKALVASNQTLSSSLLAESHGFPFLILALQETSLPWALVRSQGPAFPLIPAILFPRSRPHSHYFPMNLQ